MKKIICVGCFASAFVSSFGQGTIDFINRNISTVADPTVLYNVPLYVMGGRTTGTGAGNLPGGVTVGLFLPGAADNAAPLVSTPLRTGTPTAAQFFAISAQTATIPGAQPGATANLLVRAWQGSSFAAAKAGAGTFAEWGFTSQPLGGTPPGEVYPFRHPE